MAKNEHQNVWVVIPAAGIGKRMQSKTPKQYININNKTILEHTINCFINHPQVAGCVVALSSDDPYWKSLKIDSNSGTPIYTVEGGNERSDSVAQALDYLSMVERLDNNSWVMVHDAARPCLKQQDIARLLALRETSQSGGILASPVRDTMKRAKVGESLVAQTESREDLWHALTPQLFRLGELKQALQDCLEKGFEVTDESSAMEAMGYTVNLVEGDSSNIKITRPADIELATWLLSRKGDINGDNE
ncbi:MAG: 2-C-methyl-D-erythritol 4-phosphate cytidylyltransferase [Cocleimonas sp.]